MWLASASPTKQLVAQLPKKKATAKKPKNYGKLSQKEKFIAAAKAHGADETGETFLAAFKSIATNKAKTRRND